MPILPSQAGHCRDLPRATEQTVRPTLQDADVSTTGEPKTSPTFDYALLVCGSFDDLLEGRGTRVDATAALSRASTTGALLLQARGGAGKTFTARRLLEQSVEDGATPLFANASDWLSLYSDRDEWLHLPSESIFAAADAPFSSGAPTILVLDGLNEVGSPVATQLIKMVEELAQRYPRLTIVVTDRLSRRELTPNAWVLATLGPVPIESIQAALMAEGVDIGHGDVTLLTNPYYLDQALKARETSSTRSASHDGYLRDHAGLTIQNIETLAAASWNQYRMNQSRRIDAGQLREDVGQETYDKLTTTGVLKFPPSNGFAHHLLQDFLAARYLSKRPALWTRDSFDVLTFRASSFDALVMLLEQSAGTVELIRQVHDWNLYAAAYLLSESRKETTSANEVETALLAMLAERQFDRMVKTAEQVRDALRVNSSPLASKLLALPNVGDVLTHVKETGRPTSDSSSWYLRWYELFTRPLDLPADAQLVQSISSPDIEGWTASNVLKRYELGSLEVEKLVGFTVDENPTIRWRAVHVLGSSSGAQAYRALLAALRTDEDEWVRYGALRSLIEMAAHADDDDLPRTIFGDLASEVMNLFDQPRLLREFERAILVSNPPAYWVDTVGIMIEKLWAASIRVVDQDRWRSAGAAIRKLSALS